MRRTLPLAAIAAVVVVASAALAASFPATIPLPNGWQPEGITVGDGTTFYVGSIPTGAVYRGDLRTGKGATLVAGAPGRAAIGVASSWPAAEPARGSSTTPAPVRSSASCSWPRAAERPS